MYLGFEACFMDLTRVMYSMELESAEKENGSPAKRCRDDVIKAVKMAKSSYIIPIKICWLQQIEF
jgi:hypothetical protein